MKVSIITRAFDRLEYTIRCINGVRSNAGFDDYEHIVVNQGSRDGTGEWLKWIERMPNRWYGKVKPIHLRNNVGDFGGMKVGFERSAGDVIMQLDNDMYMATQDWLAKMLHAFEALDADVLMAERKGFKERIGHDAATLKILNYGPGSLECARIPKAVSCYLIRRKRFEDLYKKAVNCRQLTTNDNCWVVLNVFGEQIEGYSPADGSYIQHDKYGFQAKKSFLSKKFIFKHGRRRAP